MSKMRPFRLFAVLFLHEERQETCERTVFRFEASIDLTTISGRYALTCTSAECSGDERKAESEQVSTGFTAISKEGRGRWQDEACSSESGERSKSI